AGRLLAAAEGWLRNAAADADAHAAAAPGSPDMHVHAGEARNDSPCQFCPFCQVISAARKVRPEVVEHLAEAATSILLALRTLAEPQSSEPQSSGQRPRSSAPQATHEPAAQRNPVAQHITIN
ncbi:MAG: hypothetical protein ABI912_11390, partial [Actinomycetota bacterium]